MALTGVEKLPTVKVEAQTLYHGTIVPRQEYIHPPVRDAKFGNGAYFTDNFDIAKAYATLKRDAGEELVIQGDEPRATVCNVAVSGMFLDLRKGYGPLAEFLCTNGEAFLALFDKLVAERESGQSRTIWEVEGITFAERRMNLECVFRVLEKGDINPRKFESEMLDILPIFLSQCGISGRIDSAAEIFFKNGDLVLQDLTQWVVFNPGDAKVVKEISVEP